jgi:membrane associated rhomboid family serine protease
MTCYRHPGRVTGRACTRCGRPACPECLVQASVGSHCVDCVKASLPPATERLRRWNATRALMVAPALIALNAGAYVWAATTRNGERKLAVNATAVHNGEWWRLITSGFLHFNILHIAMNMFALYQLGLLLEPALGRLRFGSLYFASLLAGSAGAIIASPHVNTGGASGAIFGLLGAAIVGLHRRGINVWKTGLGPILLINLFITFTIPGISIGGHLGGLVAGGIVGGVMLRPTVRLGREIDVLGLATGVAVAALAVVIAFSAAAAAV